VIPCCRSSFYRPLCEGQLDERRFVSAGVGGEGLLLVLRCCVAVAVGRQVVYSSRRDEQAGRQTVTGQRVPS